MSEYTSWMKLVRWSRRFRPGAKQLMGLPSTICLLVSAHSASASGVNGLPPVVIHPLHTFTTPVHVGGGTTQTGNTSGSQSGNNKIVNTSSQSGGGSGNTGTHAGNNTGSNSGNQNGSHHRANQANATFNTTQTNVVTGSHSGTTGAAAQNAGTLPSGGYQLDLASKAVNIVLGSTLFNSTPSVTINVGGTPTTFTSGNKVTAAEYVAIQQALSSPHGQTLLLSQNGTADGGQFTLNKVVNANVTEVVVPKNVTALDFASTSNNTLTINGGLTNYGSVIDVSKQSTEGVISATNITNEKGGVISSVQPASLQSMLANTVGSLDLSLSAANGITNAGTISSSGALTLATASGGIDNTNTGTINGTNNVSLSVGNGNLNNGGTVSSTNGHININAPASTDVNINAVGGTFQASNGNINVRTADYNGSSNINLTGGNYLSQNLNLNSGAGAITGSVGQVSGHLNSFAGTEHFLGSSTELVLGNNTVKGDPTFANNAGGIQISGANSFNAAVAILASGSITDDGTGSIATTGVGQPVTLVAGAAINLAGDSNSPAGNPGILNSTTPGITPNPIFVTLTNANGGNIDLSNFTSGTAITTVGGTVMLLANSNSSSTGRIVFSPTTLSVDTANAAGNGGDVTIIAGAPSTATQPSIQLGNIRTSGSGTSGNVTIMTAQPSTGPSAVVFQTNGTSTFGSFSASTTTLNAQVSTGNIQASGSGGASDGALGGNAGSITITAGGNIQTGFLQAYGGGGAGGDAAVNGGTGGNGNSITLASTNGSITVNGEMNASGGGGGGGGGSTTGTSGSGGAGGTAGAISITASATAAGLVRVSQVLAADGAAGGAGSSGFTVNGGGGGGASFGGGGGAGAAGFHPSSSGPGAGGGGGGFGFEAGGGGGGGTGGGLSGGDGFGGGGGGALLSGIALGTAGGAGGAGGAAGSGGTAGTAGNSGSNVFGAGNGGAGGNGGSFGEPGGSGGTSALSNPANAGPGGANGSVVSTTSGNNTITIFGPGVTTNFSGSGGQVFGSVVNIASTGNNVLALQDNVTGSTSVSLTAGNNGGTGPLITLSAGKSITTSTLTAVTTGGGIGTVALPIVTNASTLQAATSGAGDVNVNDTNVGAVTTSGFNTGNTYNLTVATGSITVASPLQADNVFLETPLLTVTNVGFIETFGGTLAVDNSHGNLSFSIAANSLEVAALQLSATGNVDLGGMISSGSLQVTLAANALVVAGGNIFATGAGNATINVAGSGPENGGSVTMIAGVNYTVPAAGSANNLQIIPVNIPSTTGGSIIFDGSQAGTFAINAINTGSANAGGGNVTLLAAAPAGKLGQILLPATGAGLTTGGATANGSVTAYAIGNTGSASTAAITVGTVNTSGSATGSGTIDLETGTAGINGGTPSANVIFVNGVPNGSSGTFANTPGGTGGITTGALTTQQGSAIVNANGNVSVASVATTHNLTLSSTTGSFSLPGANSIVLAADASGDGGNLVLNAPLGIASYLTSGTTALSITANGTTGTVGTVKITTASALTLGSGANSVAVTAQNNAAGGSLTVLTTAALTVNPTSILVTPSGASGTGGLINLTGNTALITGSLSVNGSGAGEAGGMIDITTDSATIFTVGTAVSNGVNGSLSASGTPNGIISITNNGGGIQNTVALNNAATISLTTAGTGSIQIGAPITSTGTVSFDAGGTGNVVYSGAAQTITAPTSVTFVSGGSVGTATAPLTLSTPAVNVNGLGGVFSVTNALAGGQALNSTAASLAGPVTYAGTGNVTVNGVSHSAFTVANNITITTTSGGNIILGGSLVSTAGSGTINLTTSGTGTFSDVGTAAAVANTLNLANAANIGATGTPYNTNATNLSVVSTGLVDIANQAAGGVTLTNSTTANAFTLFSNGNLTVNTTGLTNAAAIGLVTTGNNGSIIFNDQIGNATAGVGLGANGTGSIQQTSATGFVVQASSLNLAGAGGGIFLNFDSNNLTANGTGIVSLGNFSLASTTVNTSSAGKSFSLGGNGPLSLGSITAHNGFLNILSDGVFGALLQVNSSATETANNGAILLRQANTATGQIVVLGGPTALQTTGTGGPVDLIIGTTVPTPVAGVKPATVTVNTTAGTAFFGTNSIDVPNAPVTLNLKGSNIQFSTGTRPASAIVLGPGVVITADPIGVTGVSTPAASPLPSREYRLDLTSTTANIILGSAIFNGQPSVTINLGGTATTYTAGNKVTAAEYVAIQQALTATPGQTVLALASNGTADGGQFTLNKFVNANVTEVVVPQNVTALDLSSKSNSTLTIAGGLTNYGSIVDLAKPNSVAVISAADIINEKGAMITTVLSSSQQQPSGTNVTGTLDLSLNSSNSFTNAGTIAGSGTVNLGTTNGAITNSGTISAANNVNVNAGNGNLTNTGLIVSDSGSININAQKTTDINVNATGGTFQANAGNINVRSSDYTGNANINLAGGNYLSKNLNLNAGGGAINTNVGQISGNLNSTASVEHFLGSTSNLSLGNNTVDGDPTFANTGGNITINGLNTFGQDVAILASGNIMAGNSSAAIKASGSNVFMVAGAAITIQQGGSSTSAIPGTDLSNSGAAPTATATVNFAAPVGGNIDLTGSTASTIVDTSTTSGNGGKVTLIAQADGLVGGQVLTNVSSTINTSTTGSGDNGGDVKIIASASSPSPVNTIQLGTILTGAGANGNGGNVLIVTQQPSGASGSPTVVFNTSGMISSGGPFQGNGAPIANAGVLVSGAINTAGSGGISIAGATASGGANAGSISIQAGGSVTTNNLLAFGAGGGGGAGGTIGPVTPGFVGGAGGNGASVFVTSSHGSIDIAGLLNSSGGGGGGGGGGATDGATASAGGKAGSGGNAGSVVLIGAQGAINVSAGTLSGDGGAGQTGSTAVLTASGSGGPGGGSFGGGGGSAGSGQANAVNESGGGGGGYFGGGSGGMSFSGSAPLGGGGGSGSAGGIAGSGSAGNGAPGTFLTGGAGGGSGGTFGVGGSSNGKAGANGLSVPGFSGASVTPSQNNDITMTGSLIVLGSFSGQAIFGRNITYSSPAEIIVGTQTATNIVRVNTTGAGTFTNAALTNFNVGNLNFAGQSLAILSGGGITAGTINLSNALGGGGNLTLIADSNFTPINTNAPPFPDNKATYTTTGVSIASGNINVGAISTFSGAAGFAAGSVTAVNYGGSITLGPVDAHADSSTGIGGALTVIGKGVTLGTVNTAAFDSGPILIAAGTTTSNVSVVNGGLIGSFVPSALNGNITLGGTITAGGSHVFLENGSTGAITQTSSATTIGAHQVTLVAGSGGIGTMGAGAIPLSVNTPVINLLSSAGAINLLNSFSAGQELNSTNVIMGGPMTYSGTGNLTVNGASHNPFVISGNVTVTSSVLGSGDVAGNIILGGNLTSFAGGGILNLTTSGAGTFSDIGGGEPVANTINLANTANIGAVGSPFNITANNLSVVSTGLVDIANEGGSGLTLTNSTTKNSFILFSNSNLTISTTGLQAAAAIGLITTGNNGSIIFNQQIGNATAGVGLSAEGTGLIQQTNAQGFVVQASSLNLSGAGGGIFLGFNSNNITATGTGLVSLGDFSFASSIVNPSSAATSFSLGANGSLNLGSITANNGFLNILSAGALLQVNSGATETANNGFILFRQADTTTGQIVVQGGPTTLQTTGTGGAVDIIIGVTTPTPVAGIKPANVTVNEVTTGTAFFGTNSISAPNAPVTLNLKGSNIQFSTGALSAAAIVLGPGVTITADPIGSVASQPLLNQALLSQTLLSQGPAALAGESVASGVQALRIDSGHVVANMVPSLSANTGLISAINAPIISAAVSPSIVTSLIGSGGSNVEFSAAASNVNPAASNVNPAAVNSINSVSAAINSMNSINSFTAAFNSMKATEASWMSDTELSTGQIPAVLFEGDEFGIKQPVVSSVLEMEEADPTASTASEPMTTMTVIPGVPLAGGVSRTAGGTRVMNFNRGSVVMAPARDTIVVTQFGEVKVSAKSIVLMMSFRHGLTVFNLDDAHLRSVIVKSGNHELVLSPGMHATITNDSVENFQQINPAELIGHRSLTERAAGKGMKAFVSEFSVPQAVSAVMPLKQLVNGRHPRAQKVAGHMLKTAAILMQMRSGDYERMVRPVATAYQVQVDSTWFGENR